MKLAELCRRSRKNSSGAAAASRGRTRITEAAWRRSDIPRPAYPILAAAASASLAIVPQEGKCPIQTLGAVISHADVGQSIGVHVAGPNGRNRSGRTIRPDSGELSRQRNDVLRRRAGGRSDRECPTEP